VFSNALTVCVTHAGGFMSADGELEERGMVDLRPMSAPPPKLSFTTTRQTDTFPANGEAVRRVEYFTECLFVETAAVVS